MILTNCAACAAPLQHPAKQCSRCKTRYCGAACQKQHWDAGAGGAHKDLCKKIKKGGGAEQYHANKKYKEAVAVAVEACADDTKGHLRSRRLRGIAVAPKALRRSQVCVARRDTCGATYSRGR